MVNLTMAQAILAGAGLALVGYLAGSHHYRIRQGINLKSVITVLAIIATIIAAWASLWWLSPSLFAEVSSILPNNIQNYIFADYLLRGDMGIIAIIAVAAGLWWWRAKLENREGR